MPRDLEFDRNAAMDLALDLFWRHGFNGTSMRDLSGRLGVSLSSLYNTFGDKRSLFLSALDWYEAHVVQRRLEDLTRGHTPLGAIEGLFRFAAEGAADPVRRGCFLVNTALEMSPHDPGIERQVREKLGRIEAFLRNRLEAAQAQGDLPRGVDPASRAAHLLGALLGLRVLARANPDPETLGHVVRGALSGLASLDA